MSRSCDHIKDLNDKKEVWKLAVRIDDIWSNTKSSKEYAEMVIRDMKGDSIHVLFGPEEYKKRKDEFAALMKLKTCLMSNFRLQPNDDKFKLTPHPFKLHIISGTTIKPNDMPTMPDYFFKFMKFDDIKSMTFREDILVDVIGAVHEIGSAQTTASTGKLNISFRIKDLSGTVLDCILWESVASNFMEYCKNRTEEGPMIMIIRRARLQKPTVRYPLQISNAWNGTKLIINQDIPDINEFKKSLPADNSYATQNKMMSFSSQRFASSAGGSQMTPEDNFIQNYRILKLSDIMRLPKDEICVTVVKTTCLKPSDRHKTADPILRFRIDVQVSDGDDKTKFVFWDNSCIDLLGVTASELQKQMLEDGVTDPLEYPENFDEMMGRTFAFRVKWQKDWKACSVLECKDSKVLVSRIQKELNIEIPVDSAETCHSTKSVQPESSQPKEIEVQCSQSVQPQVLDSLDEVQVVSQDLSASADFDPLNETNLTPSKRSPVKENIDDILSAQQSSTKLIKTRSTKHIKIEKS
ncbi:hypothetical protein QL285_083889 [Trifolium repens]|nr:hypothetical protein QL285_083889 [Trifolium repens]